MASEVKRGCPFNSDDRPLKRQCNSDPLINDFPLELFQIIFSFLSVKNHVNALRVCKNWSVRIEAIPSWKQFKTHFVTLSRLFPHLTLDERKAELEKNNFGKTLDRGRYLHKLFSGRRELKTKYEGAELCLEDNPKKREIEDKKILCWAQGSLFWLDTETFDLSDFPLGDFHSVVKDENPTILPTVIKLKYFHKILCVDDRYLIVLTKSSIFLLIDKRQKNFVLNSLSYYKQWPFLNFTVWNHSVFFSLTAIRDSQTSLIVRRLDLESKEWFLVCQRTGMWGQLKFHAEDDFLVVTRKPSAEHVFSIINKKNEEIIDRTMARGMFLGTTFQSVWTLDKDDSDPTKRYYREYVYSEETWKIKETVVEEIHHGQQLILDDKYFSVNVFYPNIFYLWQRIAKEIRKVEFRNLQSFDLLTYLNMPEGALPRDSYTLIGDYFLFNDNSKYAMNNLYGMRIGEELQEVASLKITNPMFRPVNSKTSDHFFYTRGTATECSYMAIPIREPRSPIVKDIKQAATFFIAGDYLLVQDDSNIFIYEFKDPTPAP